MSVKTADSCSLNAFNIWPDNPSGPKAMRLLTLLKDFFTITTDTVKVMSCSAVGACSGDVDLQAQSVHRMCSVCL